MKVRINEAEYDLKNGEKGKLAVFLYAGDEDPRPILNNAVRNYVQDNDYYEFIDANLNCPWVRVVMSDINGMKQYTWNDFIVKFSRKKKLDKINEFINESSQDIL